MVDFGFSCLRLDIALMVVGEQTMRSTAISWSAECAGSSASDARHLQRHRIRGRFQWIQWMVSMLSTDDFNESMDAFDGCFQWMLSMDSCLPMISVRTCYQLNFINQSWSTKQWCQLRLSRTVDRLISRRRRGALKKQVARREWNPIILGESHERWERNPVDQHTMIQVNLNEIQMKSESEI